MPGTWLPATASAVSASRPKMLLIQAEAKPSSAARLQCVAHLVQWWPALGIRSGRVRQ